MKRLLDIGCGPAPTVLEAIEDSGWNVEYVGLDASEKVIETARRRHPEAMFVKALIPYDFRFGKLGGFDIVTAFTFFEYLNRPEKAAAVCGANQVLHKYGEVVSTFSRKKEEDATEIEQFFKSLGYDVNRDYVGLDFEGIEGSRHFWTVVGKKEDDVNTEKKFSKYKAMAYLKAGRVKEAGGFGFPIRSLADELYKLESIDIMAKPKKLPEYSTRIKELEKEEKEIEEIRKNITPQMRRIRKYYNMYKRATERAEEIQREKAQLIKEYQMKMMEITPKLII